MEKHTELDAVVEVNGRTISIDLCKIDGRYLVDFRQGSQAGVFSVSSLSELKDFLNDIIKATEKAEL